MKRDMITMPALRYGSVCSGIEAATVAWHPLGWEAAWFSEIEPFPSAALAHHYPAVPNLGDMTLLADRVKSGEVEAPDVLVGGTPCQAYSVAGLRAGLADPRGALTIKYVELADEIDAARTAAGKPPVIIVWENVPGVLSSKDNAFGCFLGGLAGEDSELLPPGKKWADAGCVYGPKRTIAWRILDAQYIGLAQRRRRVFVVASARNDFDPAEVLFEFEGMRRDSPPSRETGESVTGTISSRTTSGGGFGTDFECSGGLQPVVGTLQANGKAAGSATQQDAESGMLVPLSVALRGREGGATAELGDEVAGCLRASTGGGDKPHVLAPYVVRDISQTLTSNYAKQVDSSDTALGPNVVMQPIAFSSKDNGRDATIDLAPTLRSGNHDKSHADGGQPTAIAFAIQAGALRENPNSGPDGVGIQPDIAYTLEARAEVQAIAFDSRQDPVSSTHVFGTLGSSSPQAQAVAFMENQRGELRISGATDSLTRGGGKPGQGYAAAMIGMAVRRLTPRECERLQGFPDDYTLIPFGRAVRIEKLQEDWIKYLLRGGVMTFDQVCRAAADGPRYKALGNSMAVTCMAWLGQRIARALVPTNNIARVA